MKTGYTLSNTQKLYAKGGPLDASVEPVEQASELSEIDVSARYKGMTVTVLKSVDGKNLPIDYFLYNGTTDNHWKIKNITPLNTYSMIGTSLPSNYRYYLLGLKVFVKKDETNDNKPTEYKVTAIDSTNNVITWERCETVVSIDGDDIEQETTETQE